MQEASYSSYKFYNKLYKLKVVQTTSGTRHYLYKLHVVQCTNCASYKLQIASARFIVENVSVFQVKTSKFYSCHSQTQVANACECMLLTKSEGILVWNRGKPVGLVTPKQILKSFISNKAAENDQTSGSEIFRM